MTVSFTLSVRRAGAAVDFYKAAFGATELHRVESRDGDVVAQIDIDGFGFFVADEAPEYGNFSPQSVEGRGTVRLSLIVDDPDAAARQAIAAGASEVYPVADQPYGWRLGRVVDPFGHHWEIGKPVA